MKLLNRIESACVAHDCRKIIYAEDEEKNIHSVAYLVWDDESLYFLINGIDTDFTWSQSNSLLIREAINTAHQLGKNLILMEVILQQIEHISWALGRTENVFQDL